MTFKFVSFDIETATLTPDGSDPHQYRPLGICCAATQRFEVGESGMSADAIVDTPFVWKGPEQGDGLYTKQMPVSYIHDLVNYLCSMADDGYFPLTWNGLGFDFDILAEECFDKDYGRRLAHLALAHFDPAFQQLCSMGYMIGMQAAALGQGLPGKLDGMHGDLAPALWAKSPEDQATVLAYVSQDVQTTTDILLKTWKAGLLRWTSRSGRPNQFRFDKWVTCEEALKIPRPDTSWMSDPRPREAYYGWTRKYLPEQEFDEIFGGKA